VCVLSHLSSGVVFSLYLPMCPGINVSAQVPPIGVKVCTTVDLSSGQSFSPFGDDIYRGLQIGV